FSSKAGNIHGNMSKDSTIMEEPGLKSRKRKRKHGTTAADNVPLPPGKDTANKHQINGSAVKRAKKRKHGEGDDQITNMSAVHVQTSGGKSDGHSKGLPEASSTGAEQEDNVHVNDGPGEFHVEMEKEQAASPRVADQSMETDLPSTTPVSLPTTSANPRAFKELDLSTKTMQAIEEMGFESMTAIQQMTIPPLMAGRDVLGAAKTG
ncbi:MAG: hypothetical protein Q9181_008346, partial [Wetmoreana brouardii]